MSIFGVAATVALKSAEAFAYGSRGSAGPYRGANRFGRRHPRNDARLPCVRRAVLGPCEQSSQTSYVDTDSLPGASQTEGVTESTINVRAVQIRQVEEIRR